VRTVAENFADASYWAWLARWHECTALELGASHGCDAYRAHANRRWAYAVCSLLRALAASTTKEASDAVR
jgi:hypothetical protein